MIGVQLKNEAAGSSSLSSLSAVADMATSICMVDISYQNVLQNNQMIESLVQVIRIAGELVLVH